MLKRKMSIMHEVTICHAYYEYLEEETLAGAPLIGVYIANLNKLALYKFKRYFNLDMDITTEVDLTTVIILKLVNKRGIEQIPSLVEYMINVIELDIPKVDLIKYLNAVHDGIKELIPDDVLRSNYIANDLDVILKKDFNIWVALKIYAS